MEDGLSETRRYSHGTFVLRRGLPETQAIEEYIAQRNFLDVREEDRLATTNRRYRLYSFHMAGMDKKVVLKISSANPEYPFWRRMNVHLSHLTKDYGRKAMKGALALESAGVRTIRPLACWRHRRSSLIVDSYLLYEMVDAEFSIRQYWQQIRDSMTEVQERILGELVDKMAQIVSSVHAAGLLHGDIAGGNFLVAARDKTKKDSGGHDVWLIDTDSISRNRIPVPFLKRIRDLRSLRRMGFDRDRNGFGEVLRQRFLRVYLGDEYSSFWQRVFDFCWQEEAKK